MTPSKKLIRLTVATIQELVFRGDVVAVNLPTMQGRIGILPGHQTMIGLLEPGIVEVRFSEQEPKHLAVTTGYFEVRANSDVVILADSADITDTIDLDLIRQAKERAEKDLKEHDISSGVEFAHLEEVLARETSRLNVAEKTVRNRRPSSA